MQKNFPGEIDKSLNLHYNGGNARMKKQYRGIPPPKRAGHWLKACAEGLGKDIFGAGV